jgi:hypothetical protein
MPSPAEVERIKLATAQYYRIDLDLISKDDQQLKNIINAQATINSSQIYGEATTITDSGPTAFVPDLETFSYTDVTGDPRLSPRCIEQNLDEALRYVETCLQQRQYYAETAKLRNDTRFKSEEFIRLDLVHQDEVDAGLYKLPWMEAADDNTALQESVAQTATQQSVLDDMMQAGASGKSYSAILSNASVSDYIQKSAQLAKDSAGENKLAVFDGSTATTAYRANLEYATWIQALASIKANLPQLKGKLATAQRKEEYLRKDEGFRSHRAAISRHLAYLQLEEHSRPNSAINYAERLDRQRDLFTSNLRALSCTRFG